MQPILKPGTNENRMPRLYRDCEDGLHIISIFAFPHCLGCMGFGTGRGGTSISKPVEVEFNKPPYLMKIIT